MLAASHDDAPAAATREGVKSSLIDRQDEGVGRDPA